LQHLRLPFSFLLLPVFLLALATVPQVLPVPAIGALFLIHFVLYPSSSAYNSLQDQDEGPIGGLERPPPPPATLGPLTLFMDLSGMALSLLISPLFTGCYAATVVLSRLYSYRGVRLKKYPFLGYLVVVFTQGGLTYFMSFVAISGCLPARVPVLGMAVSTVLLGAFYPVSQIYQHRQDAKDGVRTLSALLGVRGTFIWCAVFYGAAFALLGYWFVVSGWQHVLPFLLVGFLPVIFWFLKWAFQCFQNPEGASFRNTMQMSWRAAVCTNISFFAVFLLRFSFV
jgi:1,4-dihydroxy-2-naphthoate octaprenyltransferase